MKSDHELSRVLEKQRKGEILSELDRLMLICHRWTETRSRAEMINPTSSEQLPLWEIPLWESGSTWLWICLPNNPGDLVMALWVVHALKLQYPEFKICFWADYETRTLVENHPEIDMIGILPRKFINSWDQTQSVSEMAESLHKQLFKSAKPKPHIIINLSQDSSVALWLSLFDCTQRYGAQVDTSGNMILIDPWTQWLFAIPSERKQNPYHAVDLYLRIAQVPQKTYTIARWTSTKTHFSPTSEPIALQLGSAWPGKEWPLQEWSTLVHNIINNSSQKLILIGAKNEWEKCEIIRSISPQRIENYAGQTELSHLGSLLQSCGLLITGDTFAQHAAAVVQTPVLALYGCSSPIETGPYGIGHRVLVQENLTESETFDFEKSTALGELKAEMVWRVLCGKSPNAPWELWESYWDTNHSCLAWKRIFPTGQSEQIRANVLYDLNSKWELPSFAQLAWLKLGEHMEKVQNKPNDIQFWKDLEACEEEFEHLTHSSMAAEIYRFQRNALNWRMPLEWLNKRHQLWNHWNHQWDFS